jgi:hypothetical protein
MLIFLIYSLNKKIKIRKKEFKITIEYLYWKKLYYKVLTLNKLKKIKR